MIVLVIFVKVEVNFGEVLQGVVIVCVEGLHEGVGVYVCNYECDHISDYMYDSVYDCVCVCVSRLTVGVMAVIVY